MAYWIPVKDDQPPDDPKPPPPPPPPPPTAACSNIELSFISSLICLHCSYLFHSVMNTKATSSCPSPRTTPLFVNSVGARVLDNLGKL